MILLTRNSESYLPVMEAAVAGARENGWSTPEGQSLNLGKIALAESAAPRAGTKPSNDFGPKI